MDSALSAAAARPPLQRLRHLFLVAIFLLCASTNALATHAPPPTAPLRAPTLPSQLKIATYNVENYGAINRRTPHGFRSNYPKSEASKLALRETIRELDADILLLQEMGPIEYLKELQRDLKFEGMNYPHLVLMRGPDTQRHLAALSRIPFASVHEHTPLRFQYLGRAEDVKRGLLELRVDTSVGPLALWAVHLKSRYTDSKADPESAARRAGEAMRIREFVLQRISGTKTKLYLILGDFNDTKVSTPLRYLMQRGDLKISYLLPATDSRGEHWTYHNARNDTYARVDHALVSPALLPFIAHDSAQIFDGPHVRAASDHRPLLITLELALIPKAPAITQPPSLSED